MGQGERVILPAFEAEGLVQIIVLSWSRFHMCVDLDGDDVGVLVVSYGRDASLELCLTQPNVDIAVDYPDDSQETIEAPDGNERP
jgi:hypothetical protein